MPLVLAPTTTAPNSATIPTPDTGADIFVDPVVGVDSLARAGNMAAPWKTISYALANGAGGKPIWALAGTHGQVNQTVAYNKSAFTFVRPYPGHTVLLQGVNLNIGAGNIGFQGFKIQGQGFLIAKPKVVAALDLEINALNSTAMNFRGGGDDVTLARIWAHDGNAGILFQSRMTWTNLYLDDIKVQEFHSKYGSDGVTVLPADGLNIGRPSSLSAPHKNFFFNKLQLINVNNGGIGGHSDGVSLALPIDGLTIQNSSVFGGRGFLISPLLQATDSLMAGLGAVTNMLFRNNYMGGYSDFSLRLFQAPGAIIVHNTFDAVGPSQFDGLDIRERGQTDPAETNGVHYETDPNKITRDLVFANNYASNFNLTISTLTQTQMFSARGGNLLPSVFTYTRQATDVNGTPTFVDRTGGNLRLATGSQGIGIGIGTLAAQTWFPTKDVDNKLRPTSGADAGAFQLTAAAGGGGVGPSPSECPDLQDQIDALTAQNATLTADRAAALAAQATAESALATANTTIAARDATIATLNTNLATTESARVAAVTALNAANAQVSALQAQISVLQAQLAACQNTTPPDPGDGGGGGDPADTTALMAQINALQSQLAAARGVLEQAARVEQAFVVLVSK